MSKRWLSYRWRMAEITKQNSSRQDSHRIIRSDGLEDSLTRTTFESYNTAYDALDRYYRDFCCSDDDRIEYTIVTETKAVISTSNGRQSAQNTVAKRTENQKNLT